MGAIVAMEVVLKADPKCLACKEGARFTQKLCLSCESLFQVSPCVLQSSRESEHAAASRAKDIDPRQPSQQAVPLLSGVFVV